MTELQISTGRCQFCHAKADDGDLIIAGDSAFICEGCVEKCNAILSKGSGDQPKAIRADRYVFQRLEQHFEPLPLNELQAVSRNFPLRQQADLQIALDELLGERKVPENFIGAQNHGRGRVLSLEQSHFWAGGSQRIRVHELDPVKREDVVLSEATLKTVERNVLQFAEQRQAMRDLGLSTQKGLLFHGSPGTGKTHCIRYLSSQLADHTTLLITAEQAGLLSTYMALARLLQPALVVIEDADLIGRNRDESGSSCDEAMLNKLLNELDGLREKADVFFILTTNRPDSLEPALASRPGRVDQAIEFALPEEPLRRRLVALYGRGIELPKEVVDDLAKRSDGASPAFIKELMRRVAQHHLEAGGKGAVTRQVAEAALHEMLFSGGVLNARLLGGKAETRT